jgi:UDP-N-acetylglucosamine acyltransferase
MAVPHSCIIHPTAIIAPEAELGEGVVVGPFCIIDGPARIGPECVLKPHVLLCGAVTMGRGNTVFTGAVIGEQPQHVKYAGELTSVEIGDHNIFRENVTIHRGTKATGKTIIGSHNFFMAGSHVAHDCVVGNDCILANNALVAGHCVLADNVFLSGNSAIHQFVRLGRLSLLSGCAGSSKDIPPFIMQRGYNLVVGVNVVGMRRAGLNAKQINGVRRTYHLLFRLGLTLPIAMDQAQAELGHIDTVQELLDFVKSSTRGIAVTRGIHHGEAA